jgi:hypothetical protein
MLGLWLGLERSVRRQGLLRWALLLNLAVLIHFYLFFMVGVLWVAWCLRGAWSLRGRALVELSGWMLATVAVTCGVMLAAGYFQFGVEIEGDTGFGLYSAGLLTFFNPDSASLFFGGADFHGVSRVVPGWLSPVQGQYEGFAYAGLGVLLLAGLALVCTLTGRRLAPGAVPGWPNRVVWVLAPLALFIFALGFRPLVIRVAISGIAGTGDAIPAFQRPHGLAIALCHRIPVVADFDAANACARTGCRVGGLCGTTVVGSGALARLRAR